MENFFCWEYAYFLFYFFKINATTLQFEKNKNRPVGFKRQITGLKLFDNKLMGHFKVLSACHLHQKKKLIGEEEDFLVSIQVILNLNKKRIHLIVLR